MTDRLGQTPWQTVGPFFHYAFPASGSADLTESRSTLGARLDLTPEGHRHLLEPSTGPRIEGEIIEITGRVLDADGSSVADALVEIWQADPGGTYAGLEDQGGDAAAVGFAGFGRCATDEDGIYRFRTLRPGATPGPGNSLQAPHIALGVFGRGLLKRLTTRIYFADDRGLADDPILTLVPEDRRGTLLARDEAGVWRFDIRLSGVEETVFFDI